MVIAALATICVGTAAAAAEEKPVREIFVPFTDLDVLLQHQPNRVLLSRDEYNALIEKAKKTPETPAPAPAVSLSGDYNVTVHDRRAHITGTLLIDVLADGLHAVPLDITGVGLQSAKLDGRSAAIGRGDGGRLTLLVEGKGRHRLDLQMVAPLQAEAARQVLQFRLPRTSAARLRLNVPGDVEIKSGAELLSRIFDAQAEVTHFELLARGGTVALVMSPNSRLKRRQRTVVARSVLVAQLTEAYEKLHATVSLDVLHCGVDRFRFVVPNGFEITNLDSHLLDRWNVEVDGDRKLLNVHLREQTTETVVLNLSAIKTAGRLKQWRFPRLEPLEVVGHVAVVGLLVEDRLNTESLEAEGLIPIDTSVLDRALPVTIFNAEPGTPPLKSVAAYYAAGKDFSLTANFNKPPAKLFVRSNILLILDEKGQEVRGGFAMVPQADKLFEFDFTVPPHWHIAGVIGTDEKPLAFERYGQIDKPSRVRVRLSEAVTPGSQYTVNFHAVCSPEGWLSDWTQRPVEFPRFTVIGATDDVGAIAVDVRDDMTVRPDVTEQLTPLDENEKAQYGLAEVAARLAYRYETQPYKATLAVQRTVPRLTARTYSFLHVEPQRLTARYEVLFNVEEARTRELSILLPKETPAALSIRGLGNVKLKQYSSEIIDDMRRWNVLLEGARRGTVGLAVDFRQPLSEQEPKDFMLPIISAGGVAYQSGTVAVEGSTELEVAVKTDARRVDVGELVDARYRPSRRLLGAYGFVGDPADGRIDVKVDVFRRPGYKLPPAIVERAELSTHLSAEGTSQTQAEFSLRTKSLYLEIKLPEDSTLWSVCLDGEPIKPQRQDNRLLVGLSSGDAKLRNLRVVYATPVRAVTTSGRVRVPAPHLFLRSDKETPSEEIPLAELVWRLHLPSGYEVVRTGGTLVTDQVTKPLPAAVHVAGVLYHLAGGLNSPLLLPSIQCSREAAREANREAARRHAELEMMAVNAPAECEESICLLEDSSQLGVVAMQPTNRLAVKPAGSLRIEGDPFAADLDIDKPKAEEESDEKSKRIATYDSSLQGVRSLEIDLDQSRSGGERVITFRSLGAEPELVVTLADRSRFDALAYALALAVALLGLAMTNRSVTAKARLIVIVALVATLAPLPFNCVAAVRICNMIFYAAALLVPYYLAAGAAKWLYRLLLRACSALGLKAVVGATIVVLAACSATTVRADKPKDASGRYVIQVVEPAPPVNVPDDAIILPYDPKWPSVVKNADKLLVPYKRYVELWNRAYPDKKIGDRKAPAEYALAGVAYKTTLGGEDYLLIGGEMEIDVFVDGYVTIPLGLRGGVLAMAELDGKPAKLSVPLLRRSSAGGNSKHCLPLQQAVAHRDEKCSLVVLHVQGKGRHRLELAVRMRLSRQGGWRAVEGVLPAAPAGELKITVPKGQTELRLGHVADRRSFETEKADENVATVLGAGGAVSVRWRPKVAQRQVDRSLTAASTAVLDVQEDGLRLVWRLTLQFRHGRRERFSVDVPNGYLLEKVVGANVRGWEIRRQDDRRIVDVALLKAAKGQETFTLHLRRKHGQDARATGDRQDAHATGDRQDAHATGDQQDASGTGVSPVDYQFDVPAVTLAEAALHNGCVAIRRGALLRLRTLTRSGVTRTDLDDGAIRSIIGADNEESPLGIKPYQAYRFVAVPFQLRLSAEQVRSRVDATVQSVLKIAGHERNLESRVVLHVRDRAIYRVRMLLPNGLNLKHVSAPGEFQWALTKQQGRELLSIYLAAGRQGDVSVLLRGALGRTGKIEELSLPQLTVLDVGRQEGDLAVQVTPGIDVAVSNLKNCNSVLLRQLHGWLDPSQRTAVRLTLHHRGGDYGGTLKLSPRKAMVTCFTISNVRVTDRTLEETILLTFNIRNAGIRTVAFQLPRWMSDSRIDHPLLRQKTITPTGDEPDDPVRVVLEFQDEVSGQLRVLVENDRLLLPRESHTAPIPSVETGRTDRQFVVVESTGRDEVVIEPPVGLEPLGRQQKQWRMLKDILAGGITRAYMVSPEADQPKLTFKTRVRRDVKTAGARIGLAETTLLLDGAGAYRAEVIYRIDNTTEQFLTIELPEGAKLWTARVAGRPVKPIKAPNANGSTAAAACQVRIPLVKTAPGDLDYAVVLKYGGRMPSLGAVGSVRFPLVRARNIGVELSQVRLYVPNNHQWFGFGGTMGSPTMEGELLAGVVSYKTKMAERLVETARESNPFAQIRAAANLKRLGSDMEDYGYAGDAEIAGENLQAKLQANAEVMEQASQEIQRLDAADKRDRDLNIRNRDRLNGLFEGQATTRSQSVVKNLGYNWSPQAEEKREKESGKETMFNERWIDRNKLRKSAELAPVQDIEAAAIKADLSEFGLDKAPRRKPLPTKRAQPQAPQIAQGRAKVELAKSLSRRQAEIGEKRRGERDQQRRSVQRYQKLQQQQQLGVGVQPGSGLVGVAEPADTDGLGDASGLASLDVKLPVHDGFYRMYRFTTPRGEVEITARNASNLLMNVLFQVAAVAVIVVIAGCLLRLWRDGRFAWLAGAAGSTTLICVGLLSLLIGVLPIAGLAAAVAGAVVKVRCRFPTTQ